jgi:hypothetical protein
MKTDEAYGIDRISRIRTGQPINVRVRFGNKFPKHRAFDSFDSFDSTHTDME